MSPGQEAQSSIPCGRPAAGTQARGFPGLDPPQPRGADRPPPASPAATDQPLPTVPAATALYGSAARDRKRARPNRGAPRDRGGLHPAPDRARGHRTGSRSSSERRKTPD
ncbi:hypothetical protein MJG53_014054 [Ovis ammon polii x Ovis aries]|uniref:Uncharacterized protein n=1 Tax=Ovis ammon polii x Ovis aries TaxID=2918886 RepID=A0ACB9UKL8_9CETA|nr:hypothetical protein MJT46_013666 [Ovis ammon polii x Ovis aries]KAI4571948.1 hypothetical protein MJG53_014054 [Ovis ammon polii x Ovis aries]